jgi:aspartyl-tRNA(Asn)/glutamyl-tRNA(Gln) amidotransferase subunit A
MPTAEEICWLPLTELAPRIRRRELSPMEVAEALLGRIDALNGPLNAICTMDPERVRAAARAAEEAVTRGDALGPLHGIPIAVKDLIFTNDHVTTGGSTFYRDFVPDEDDVTVERLRKAGAIILGKTNVPEFGFGVGSRNPVFGVTRNPWNLERTPGGSSSGSAAAVASGMCPGALGSDGGGSVRVPASFCGLYGLKASFGRIPLYPGCRDTRYPGFSGWESLEHIGPLTRTVEDAALLLDVLAGPDSRDRFSLPREARPFADLDEPDVRGLRIAWTTDFGGYARADDDVRLAVEAAARTFEGLGARVENATPFTENPVQAFLAIVALDFDVVAMRPFAAEHPDAINERIAELIAREWSFEEVSRANARRRDLYNELWRFFERYDLLLTPATPVAAHDVMLSGPETIGGVPTSNPGMAFSFTHAFNMTGNPAASIPCGWTGDSLPIGLQIVGNHLDDRMVLRASRAFEAAAPWAGRRPPV